MIKCIMLIDCYEYFACQFVTVSLAGWGLLAYGGYKYFTKNTKDEEKEVLYSPHKPLIWSFQ